LTTQHGGEWAINHTRRLLKLITIIGEGLEYDVDVVWLAAHLHDWGGYAPWAQPGVDHAHRSTQVAVPFLAERGYPASQIERVQQCIAHHHSGDPCHSTEAILLSDADALDFLGVVGVLRDISKKPRDLRAGYEKSMQRRAKLPETLCLERSRELAAERIREMDMLLEAFERDSFGFF
jgi:uncharacterized protein